MELSTAQVAARLGVSQRQVQRLVAAGQLPLTRRVGRTELVDAAAAQRLTSTVRRRGRPWREPTAWAALWLLSGFATDWVDGQTIVRLRQRLASTTPEGLVWACRRRADATCYRASSSFCDDIRELICLTGASALRPERDLMSPPSDRVDGYCHAFDRETLVSRFFLVEDPGGNVTLRSTQFVQVLKMPAVPPVVVGLDLMESSDPREQTAGLRIVRNALP